MFDEEFRFKDEETGRKIWLEIGRSMHATVIKSVVLNSSGFRPISRTVISVRTVMRDKMEELISRDQTNVS